MSDKPASLMSVPEGYDLWLGELKVRISTAQQQAARAVNRELVLLYWQSGLLARMLHLCKRCLHNCPGTTNISTLRNACVH